MRRSALIPWIVLAVGLAAPPASGEIIVLRNGQKIQAKILKDTAEHVFVDVGYDVLSIPRAEIREIGPDETAEAEPQQIRQTDDLYSTADLSEQSVKQLAARFGEAVVLVSSPSALGSGFFITRDGHLVTNFHVIEGERRIAITVFRETGNEFERLKIEDVDIVATNSFLDLALLKANLPEDYTPTIVYLDDHNDLREGDVVFAIGNPLGLERSVSQGIVSKRNRAFEGLAYVQTTTQINPGNSGGPLFNTTGEVVGVTNMRIPIAEGLNFAIPTRYLIDFLRNREAFLYNAEASEAGYRYLQPPARQRSEPPPFLHPEGNS